MRDLRQPSHLRIVPSVAAGGAYEEPVTGEVGTLEGATRCQTCGHVYHGPGFDYASIGPGEEIPVGSVNPCYFKCCDCKGERYRERCGEGDDEGSDICTS